MFLEHISFFSIHGSSHNLIKFDLIHIDPFTLDTNTVSPSVSQAPAPVSDNVSYRVPTDSSVDSGTLVPDATIAPSLPPADQSPFETVAPLPPPFRHSTRSRKSTKLSDFTYSCYSSSFTSFLASIHRLSEPLSYREVVCDPF